ncbi:unnamed protein product [Dicrocoelium dendriticum]|nr:unnamed protein product [Dicrocoelium dendriticum]
MHNALKQLASESGDSPIVFSLVEYARTFLQSDALEMHVSGEQGGAQEVRGQAETQRVTGALTSNALSVRAHLNRSRISNSSDIDGRELQIFHGETIVDRKSVFQAHCCRVQSVEDVSRFISAVLNDRKVAAATHNILAWRFITKSSMSSSDVVLADCDDDGETHAGSRLLHLLTISCAENVAVMVSRWYGGIQLGPDRFKHINNVARQLLSLHGMLGPQQLHSEESKSKSQKQKPKKKR